MANNRSYVVETYRPAYPAKGVKINVHKVPLGGFDRADLSPNATSAWQVDHVSNTAEAVACVIEKAAGKGVSVRKIL